MDYSHRLSTIDYANNPNNSVYFCNNRRNHLTVAGNINDQNHASVGSHIFHFPLNGKQLKITPFSVPSSSPVIWTEEACQKIINSTTDPIGKFLRDMNLSAAETVKLNIMSELEQAPRKTRLKYGKRVKLTAEQRAEISRERNREHARATRRRKKVFLDVLDKKLKERERDIILRFQSVIESQDMLSQLRFNNMMIFSTFLVSSETFLPSEWHRVSLPTTTISIIIHSETMETVWEVNCHIHHITKVLQDLLVFLRKYSQQDHHQRHLDHTTASTANTSTALGVESVTTTPSLPPPSSAITISPSTSSIFDLTELLLTSHNHEYNNHQDNNLSNNSNSNDLDDNTHLNFDDFSIDSSCNFLSDDSHLQHDVEDIFSSLNSIFDDDDTFNPLSYDSLQHHQHQHQHHHGHSYTSTTSTTAGVAPVVQSYYDCSTCHGDIRDYEEGEEGGGGGGITSTDIDSPYNDCDDCYCMNSSNNSNSNMIIKDNQDDNHTQQQYTNHSMTLSPTSIGTSTVTSTRGEELRLLIHPEDFLQQGLQGMGHCTIEIITTSPKHCNTGSGSVTGSDVLHKPSRYRYHSPGQFVSVMYCHGDCEICREDSSTSTSSLRGHCGRISTVTFHLNILSITTESQYEIFV